ncbi:hypothetical protein [Streptomyces sp. NPDC047028]|uniref:hypothetical protein n=1 Tax=Streptomyces sp. NPDC047028 TaxID=3155793 RepID=UPI0033DED9FB
MGTRRFTAATVSATALAATLLSGGVANAGPAAPSPRPTTTASFTCAYKYFCVHLRHSDGSYTWKSFYYCQRYTLNGSAT